MPRRYYYRRTVRPKQKWAINTVDCNVTSGAGLTVTSGGFASFGQAVCTNAPRIDNAAASLVSAAQILKTGRWKFRGTIPTASGDVNYIIYLVYIPEGFYATASDSTLNGDLDGVDIFYRHPEWVIAWTRKDYASNSQSNEISLTGRLKRNLNTGDAIWLRVLMYNTGSSSFSINGSIPVIRGTISYCCRAN